MSKIMDRGFEPLILPWKGSDFTTCRIHEYITGFTLPNVLSFVNFTKYIVPITAIQEGFEPLILPWQGSVMTTRPQDRKKHYASHKLKSGNNTGIITSKNLEGFCSAWSYGYSKPALEFAKLMFSQINYSPISRRAADLSANIILLLIIALRLYAHSKKL